MDFINFFMTVNLVDSLNRALKKAGAPENASGSSNASPAAASASGSNRGSDDTASSDATSSSPSTPSAPAPGTPQLHLHRIAPSSPNTSDYAGTPSAGGIGFSSSPPSSCNNAAPASRRLFGLFPLAGRPDVYPSASCPMAVDEPQITNAGLASNKTSTVPKVRRIISFNLNAPKPTGQQCLHQQKQDSQWRMQSRMQQQLSSNNLLNSDEKVLAAWAASARRSGRMAAAGSLRVAPQPRGAVLKRCRRGTTDDLLGPAKVRGMEIGWAKKGGKKDGGNAKAARGRLQGEECAASIAAAGAQQLEAALALRLKKGGETKLLGAMYEICEQQGGKALLTAGEAMAAAWSAKARGSGRMQGAAGQSGVGKKDAGRSKSLAVAGGAVRKGPRCSGRKAAPAAGSPSAGVQQAVGAGRALSLNAWVVPPVFEFGGGAGGRQFAALLAQWEQEAVVGQRMALLAL